MAGMPLLSSVRTTTHPSFLAGQGVPVDVEWPSRWSVSSISGTETLARPSSQMRATVAGSCRPPRGADARGAPPPLYGAGLDDRDLDVIRT